MLFTGVIKFGFAVMGFALILATRLRWLIVIAYLALQFCEVNHMQW